MEIFVFSLLFAAAVCLPPVCDNEIYCYGPLLHTVQTASVFQDSKTFVDMKMKKNKKETMEKFSVMMKKTNNNPTKKNISNFLNEAFEPAGSEFEPWDPSDWHDSPKFLDEIDDRLLRSWARDLHGLWKKLGRKMKEDVKLNEDLYSIIYVPNPVIVPGGRFREFYYWDSYWIIRGLLESEMYDTVLGMLNNFVSIIDRFGFIPNGGRIYYKNRSQPPFFIPMVQSYWEATNDISFLKDNIHILEREFNYWLEKHLIDVEKDGIVYKLARYNDNSLGPRPESYREDFNSAEPFTTEDEKNSFYSQLKSAAETGWDFSSRWIISNGSNHGDLTYTKTKFIIPVDLNAYLCGNANHLVEFYTLLNMTEQAEKYKKIRTEFLQAVEKVLWHEEVGSWLDYDIMNNVKRDYFFPSNLIPLWTRCYNTSNSSYYVQNAINYLKKMNVYKSPGGLPTSLFHSGEQWDYPNAWPPMQHMIIKGFDMVDDHQAKEMAFGLAERWILSNFKAYNSTKAMYEKYDATIMGEYGGGGEYEVQLGFGWTNGIVLELLHQYGSKLHLNRIEPEKLTNSAVVSSSHIAPLLTVLLTQTSVAAGCIAAILYARRIYPKPSRTLYTPIPGNPVL